MQSRLLSILTLAFALSVPLGAVAKQAAAQPRVERTSPAAGARDVKPGPGAIRVVFNQPMQPTGYSITVLPGKAAPTPRGAPQFLADGRTFELPVTFEGGKQYGFAINGGQFQNFRSAGGVAAASYVVTFTTAAK